MVQYVGTLEVQPEQVDLKSASLEIILKARKWVQKRMKVIRYADQDGWKAALHYLGDDIAETEEETKRMRKSKKETENYAPICVIHLPLDAITNLLTFYCSLWSTPRDQLGYFSFGSAS